MKTAFLAFALLLSASAFADTDPFDANLCTGPKMSAERALELLGSNSSVNLAAANKDGKMIGGARMRQKLGGAVGKWFPTYERFRPISVYLVNDNGQLGLTGYYEDGRSTYQLACGPNPNSGDFTCLNGTRAPRLGSDSFTATITDHCVKLVSYEYTEARDYQWAYVSTF